MHTHQAQRDGRVRDFVPPARIVWTSTGASAPQNAACLLGNASGQALVHTPAGACVLPAGAAMLLDYGSELHGGIRLVTGNNQPRTCRLRVRFGESVSEAMGTPNNDHAMHDTVIDLPWHGTADVGNTGFRFVRLDAVGEGETIALRAAPALYLHRDLPRIGSFRCSDERLNRIWETGVRTVHLNMQDYLWDGIKRDRLVWLGDMHPEVRVICSAFDDDGIVPQSLDLARDNTPLPAYINGISSYSLWWIIIQWEWLLHKGNHDYLRQQTDYLEGLLRQLAERIDGEGREQLPPGRFLDWPTSRDEAVKHAGLQGLLSWAFAAGKHLAAVLGRADLGEICADSLERLRRHRPDGGLSKQANALLVLGRLADPRAVNAAVLSRDPLAGLSTFYGYYVLQARAMAGDVAGPLEVIRAYWGAMLDFGATTFWEDFDLAWTANAGRIDELPVPGRADLHADFGDFCYKGLRHSLCHGWAGGPSAWLTEHVLGLLPVTPGCSRLAVRPRLGDLEWAEGTLPTPHGPVQVSHRRQGDGTAQTELSLPPGVSVVD